MNKMFVFTNNMTRSVLTNAYPKLPVRQNLLQTAEPRVAAHDLA